MKDRKWTKNFEWATIQEREDAKEAQLQELREGNKFLEAYETAIETAADYLNREFPDTPKHSWAAGLTNPDLVRFTSTRKKQRFSDALDWIDTQC